LPGVSGSPLASFRARVDLLDMDLETEHKDTPAEHGRAKRTGGAYRGTDG